MDQAHWKLGWWDFYPLLENARRPFEWTRSSVIFTAHESQPLVVGRHFSSSKQFILPTAPQLLSSTATYDPPTIISVQPGDEWLFAYFPRRDGDGVGCFWHREGGIDGWVVKDSWEFQKAGPLEVVWLNRRRDWTTDAAGKPTRLPPKGPSMPFSTANMLCVTRDNAVHLYYMRHYYLRVRFMKRPLAITGRTAEIQPHSSSIEAADNFTGTRRCTHAAIALGFDDSRVTIATHSRRIPQPPNVTTAPFNSMDLGSDLAQTNASEGKCEWESWSEEAKVELFDVRIAYDNSNLGIHVMALPSFDQAPNSLTSLTFAIPPTPRQVPPTSKPALQYLISTSIDMHDYGAPPTGRIDIHLLSDIVLNGRANHVTKRGPSRTFESNIVLHAQPIIDLSQPESLTLCVCLADLSPSTTNATRQSIGSIQFLRLPSLEDSAVESSPLISPEKQPGFPLVPLFFSLSPNRTLLAGIPHAEWQPHAIIYRMPLATDHNHLARALTESILNRTEPSDICHLLASRQVDVNDAIATLHSSLRTLEEAAPSPADQFTWQMLGVAVELYREKSKLCKDQDVATILKKRKQTAHDICSVAACKRAFEDCQDSSGYQLGAVWQLISIAHWLVQFTERLMKQCILYADANSGNSGAAMPDLLCDLLHLNHPFALESLLGALKHLKNFRDLLSKYPAGEEKAHVAKATILDLVDSCGIQFSELLKLLEDHLGKIRQVDKDDCRKALAACQSTPAMQPHLNQISRQIVESTFVSKSTLFLKHSDLVDMISQLSVSQKVKEQTDDVVTKNSLSAGGGRKTTCLRCGGISQVASEDATLNPTSAAWKTWTQLWALQCVCGGNWISSGI